MESTLASLKPLVEGLRETTLSTLLQDEDRVSSLIIQEEGITADFSRQFIDKTCFDSIDAIGALIKPKINDMYSGKAINTTENRAVLHVALRASKDDSYIVDGKNVVPDVLQVQEEIRIFSDKVRNGEILGVTGEKLTNILAIGIGGSYLGAKFVYESLRFDHHSNAYDNSTGLTLKFLANVDPVDFSRATTGLDASKTLILVLSKTFTTAETMLNANLAKQWLISSIQEKNPEIKTEDITSSHMAAVSTAVDKVTAFGIDSKRIFAFWDWVGGRYSVCAAVGLLPLALYFGWDVVESFLQGARSIDQHFITKETRHNLPMMLGIIGVINSTLLKYPARALSPYAECLVDFASHIQQVDMESNGKCVQLDGTTSSHPFGEIDFGQPGTNAQHSYFQLFHQGRVVPVDFIGTIHSQTPKYITSTKQISHDELMANFFAQPDALAFGQSYDELRSLGHDDINAKHRTMPGNRPSTVLLLEKISSYQVGQLLALYEHRTAVQGFIWNINSFDQFGVELGKVLAGKIRSTTNNSRAANNQISEEDMKQFNPATRKLLSMYLQQKPAL